MGKKTKAKVNPTEVPAIGMAMAAAILNEVIDGLDRSKHIRQAAMDYVEALHPDSPLLANARKVLNK